MARVKYMDKRKAIEYCLWRYPNFHVSGSVLGMKKKVYGKNALIVRSGSWYYNVPGKVYDAAK